MNSLTGEVGGEIFMSKSIETWNDHVGKFWFITDCENKQFKEEDEIYHDMLRKRQNIVKSELEIPQTVAYENVTPFLARYCMYVFKLVFRPINDT